MIRQDSFCCIQNSHKMWQNAEINIHILKHLLVFDCPGDGTCSNQGTCDGKTGTCVCFEGFERLSGVCLGNNRLIENVILCSKTLI